MLSVKCCDRFESLTSELNAFDDNFALCEHHALSCGAHRRVTFTNPTSQRPSAFANAPYAEASIVQRDRAMPALDAYMFFLATVTRDDANADTSRAVPRRLPSNRAMLAHHSTRRGVLLPANTSMQALIAFLRANAAKRRLEFATTQLQIRDLVA